MTSLSSADTTALVFLVIIVLIMVRRTYALSQGTAYNPARVFGYGAFSSLLFVVFAATTIYVAVGTWGLVALALIAPYAGIVVASALVAEPRVRRLVKFEEHPNGQVYFRLPLIVPVLTVILFVVRVGIEVWMFGLNSIATFTLPTSLSVGALAVLIGFDLLYGVSVGLLFGRGFAIRGAYLARSKSGQPLGSS
jgi:hypothetical protein